VSLGTKLAVRKLENPDDVIGKLFTYKVSPVGFERIGLCISRRPCSGGTGPYLPEAPDFILTLLIGEDRWDVFENDLYLRLLK